MIVMESIIILVLYFAFNRALVPPTYLWPFGGDSFTYDVVHNAIGTYPAFTECFLVGPKLPGLGYSSLFLDRNTTTHLDVRIEDVSGISDFALTFFINPLNSSGIVFHYMSDDQDISNENIRHIFMTIDNGKLSASLLYKGGLNYFFPPSSSYTIPTEQWTMIAFASSTNALYLYANVSRDNLTHLSNFTLNLPGTIRFGDGQPPYPSASLYGYMTAAAFYNSVNDISISSLIQNAMKNSWPSIPSLTPCPNRVQNNVIIKHLWPLDEKGLTLDTKSNTVDENSKCLRFSQNHTSFPNRAIHIDGSPLSYITLKINGSEIDETFTLTVNVFITSKSSGSFLKIINNQDKTLFQMDILSETNVELKAFKVSNVNCATVTKSIFTTNTWYVVGIHRDVDANTIGVMINGNITDASDTCGAFGSSGELSVLIGDSNRQLVGYRTDVRCLIMFSDPGSDIMTAIHDECTDADSTLVAQVNNCPIETLRSRYHYLFKSGLVPPSSLSRKATYTSKHVTECAISCYGEPFCRSFTYKDTQCDIYDFVTEYELTPDAGAGYYVVDNRN